MTSTVDGPDGPLEVLTTGSGDPVTLFAHGVGASIEETRPYASGVPGTRVFYHARGHGRSVAPDHGRWSYADLAADLRAVADAVGASRAVGVSLGAGSLMRAVADTPDRFERMVLILPATLDRDRAPEAVWRTSELASAIERGAVSEVERLLTSDQHPRAQQMPALHAWARKAAERMVSTPVARVLREVVVHPPLPDPSAAVASSAVSPASPAPPASPVASVSSETTPTPPTPPPTPTTPTTPPTPTTPTTPPTPSTASLAACVAPVLVIGQEDDLHHPAAVAREVTEAFGCASLQLFEPGGLLWTHRRELRALVSDFLSRPAT